ncbi:MAG: type II toxin-antitoxin system prevent-host-death family antitoxin [Anaerolineae bacterium]|nr:type II toxin-antitoxin system prevent-host-death family antitoxin [Anaerolineae bacterium]
MANIWRVSATEVKNSWGRVVQRVLQRREPALVESKGVATVVILPADEYERLVAAQEAEKRRQRQLALLDQAEQFAKEVAHRYTGQSLPDSIEIIREMREERDGELMGLR